MNDIDQTQIQQLPEGTISRYETMSEGVHALLSAIGRSTKVLSLTMPDNDARTEAFDFRQYAGGMVLLPAAWIAANLGFMVCDTATGVHQILRDEFGVPVQIQSISTSAVRWYKLPDEIFSALFMRLWSKNTTLATETDTLQTGGPLAITVIAKG